MPRITNNWNTGDNGTATKFNNINQDLDELYSKGSDRAKIILASSLLPLKIDIPPFTYRVGSVVGQSVGITDLSLTNNSTNYIEISVGGVISSNTTGFDNNKARIGKVVTLAGVITQIISEKPDVIGGDLFGSGMGFQSITSTTYDGLNRLSQVVADLNTYDLSYDFRDNISQVVKNGTLTYVINRDGYGRILTTTII